MRREIPGQGGAHGGISGIGTLGSGQCLRDPKFSLPRHLALQVPRSASIAFWWHELGKPRIPTYLGT
jgi:hypothetical protein